MPVVLNTPVIPAAPSFDRVHLDNLVITLEQTEYAKTNIQARVRLYYQDPVTGVKTFSAEPKEIFIEDAEAWAVGLYQQNDMRGVEAAAKIKDILALLVSTQTPWGATTVS